MPTELNNILEQELRGLAMPDAVSWWPLAIGWWVLIIIVISSVLFITYKIISRKKQQQYRHVALNELKDALNKWRLDNNSNLYLHSSNSILKRVMRHLNRENLNTSGSKWAKELNQLVSQPLSNETIDALCLQCYRAEPNVDINTIHSQLLHWLRSHKEPQLGVEDA